MNVIHFDFIHFAHFPLSTYKVDKKVANLTIYKVSNSELTHTANKWYMVISECIDFKLI